MLVWRQMQASLDLGLIQEVIVMAVRHIGEVLQVRKDRAVPYCPSRCRTACAAWMWWVCM